MYKYHICWGLSVSRACQLNHKTGTLNNKMLLSLKWRCFQHTNTKYHQHGQIVCINVCVCVCCVNNSQSVHGLLSYHLFKISRFFVGCSGSPLSLILQHIKSMYRALSLFLSFGLDFRVTFFCVCRVAISIRLLSGASVVWCVLVARFTCTPNTIAVHSFALYAKGKQPQGN